MVPIVPLACDLILLNLSVSSCVAQKGNGGGKQGGELHGEMAISAMSTAVRLQGRVAAATGSWRSFGGHLYTSWH